MITKYLAGGTIRSGKIPNPENGTIGLFVNPEKTKGKKKMAKKKKKSASKKRKSYKKSSRKKNPVTKSRALARKRNPKRKVSRKRRGNPVDIRKIEQLLPSVIATAIGWASGGVIDALVPPSINAQVEKTLGSRTRAKIAYDALAVLAIWALADKSPMAKAKKNEALLGSGLRLAYDLLEELVPKTGDGSTKIRKVMGLSDGQAQAAPGVSGYMGSLGGYQLRESLHGYQMREQNALAGYEMRPGAVSEDLSGYRRAGRQKHVSGGSFLPPMF